MVAAHLKVFLGFLLFFMLTSGNLERTWLRNRNYIRFVSECFLAGDGQSSSGCISTITPIKSCHILLDSASLHFSLGLPALAGFLILGVCRGIRETHKKPLEVCGGFFLLMLMPPQLSCDPSVQQGCFLGGWLSMSESVKVLVSWGRSQDMGEQCLVPLMERAHPWELEESTPLGAASAD